MKEPGGNTSEITDTQRLDWLERQSNGTAWIARHSSKGNGFGLYNAGSGSRFISPTARGAIDAAMNHRKNKSSEGES
jgi:hypothetical protein